MFTNFRSACTLCLASEITRTCHKAVTHVFSLGENCVVGRVCKGTRMILIVWFLCKQYRETKIRLFFCFCFCTWDRLLWTATGKAWLLHRIEVEIHLRVLAQLSSLLHSGPVSQALAPQINPFPGKFNSSMPCFCSVELFIVGTTFAFAEIKQSWGRVQQRVMFGVLYKLSLYSVPAAGLDQFWVSCCKTQQKLEQKVLCVPYNRELNPA